MVAAGSEDMSGNDGRPRIGRPSYDEVEVAERKQRILDAAITLVPQLGSSNVRLKDIAAQAGVSVGTLQHYFASRHELIESAFAVHARRVVDGIEAAIEHTDDPWQQVCALIARFSAVKDVQSRSALWVEFAAESARNARLRKLMGDTYAEWRAILSGAVINGSRSGAFVFDITAEQAVDGICALLDGYEVANAIGVWRESDGRSDVVLLNLIARILGYSGAE
ncbi:TetR/AcrR family transcriptional regulator [Mycolicibacterium goodii]|nr:TetR/AcrR family transcriptional regulator [Mycolicibacterium goodii]MBU8808285.1 TetR/AcrR family transcriptional regulator [Mycolicibacterium goodii]MBU8841047.1 TetR/AcrR family transcriptional regulator [Mycolicibacterium goodii]OKH64410.1 hypothetical protein EB74_10070 [Mycobacterium sp. SWH-M5]